MNETPMLMQLGQPTAGPPQADPDEAVPSRFRMTADSRAEAADRRRAERDLANATRDGRLALHYQPRLMLESGRRVGAEALIRWPRRKRGLHPQGLAMPLAEGSGQAAAIGAWALATACRDAAGWPEGTVVSVSIATSQLTEPDLLGHVAAALDGSGLSPERLELGLGESMLQDIDGDAYLALAAVRDLGVGLAVEDFGSGIGSLTMLRRLPLTMLRLDRAMIRDLPADREAVVIARSIIDAGHALGLGLAAVGIETEPQRKALADCGCDEGQGPLFGVPLEGERIGARLVG